MSVCNRFPSVYEKRQCDVTLFTLTPSVVFWTGFLPPLLGAIIAIGTALLIHQDSVTNYNWICGRAFLPSLSRIINLPFERIIWQLFIYFHAPLRLLELTVGFRRYDRLQVTNLSWKYIYQVARWGYAIFGTLEVIFLVGLSAVGENEHGVVHVFLFYTFGVFAFLFFVANTMCHSQSLYHFNPYGIFSYRFKLVVSALYLSSIPLIAIFYSLYWKACITFGITLSVALTKLIAYELFAFTEYCDVFLSITYHGCAFLDIRHKAIFRVSYTPRKARNNPLNFKSEDEADKGIEDSRTKCDDFSL